MRRDSSTYGGGITYNGFEIVEVLLGKGNETLTIDDTGDRDEKAGTSTLIRRRSPRSTAAAATTRSSQTTAATVRW